MVNFVEFVLGLVLALIVALLIILITGIIHNKPGYVSIIEKKHKFYCVEIRKYSFYMPLLYHKVRYYPTGVSSIKVNGYKITYQIQDYIKLYISNRKIKEIIQTSSNLKEDFARFGIKLIEIKN